MRRAYACIIAVATFVATFVVFFPARAGYGQSVLEWYKTAALAYSEKGIQAVVLTVDTPALALLMGVSALLGGLAGCTYVIIVRATDRKGQHVDVHA